MNLYQVKEHFEPEAFNYDSLIPRLIPYYHEQHTLMLNLIPFKRTANLRALDLGAGTGILSALILKAFPQTTVVALDFAENMLTACRRNLSVYQDRVIFRRGNFAVDDIGAEYDLVVAGSALHHLDDLGKQKLLKRLFSAMNPGGCFLCQDIVYGASPDLTEQYETIWRQYIRSNGENDEHWFSKYLEEDMPSSVEDQMKWLIEAGFEDVGCHWRYLNFAIFGGQKHK